MKLLLIDNFDSFVYNLYQYLRELGNQVDVVRNNAITLDQIVEAKYDKIIISPGPGNPENPKDFGVCSEIIKVLGKYTPILGVCLGHQGIINVFGGKIIRAAPMHGKSSLVKHNNSDIFEGVKNPFKAMRYHSLVGDRKTIPASLEITAESEDGEIMAVKHREFPIYGIQFHSESILTEEGKKILDNFCKL